MLLDNLWGFLDLSILFFCYEVVSHTEVLFCLNLSLRDHREHLRTREFSLITPLRKKEVHFGSKTGNQSSK